MKERKSMLKWIKEHKTELTIAGLSIGTLILIALGIKNRAVLNDIWKKLQEAIKASELKKTLTTAAASSAELIDNDLATVLVDTAKDEKLIPVNVREFIRNLPSGHHASPEKIAEALQRNIDLTDGQTLVDSYTKMIRSAA